MKLATRIFVRLFFWPHAGPLLGSHLIMGRGPF
jgi:hypothetical protein